MKVIGNEGGDNVFFAIWDNEEVASASTVEIVLPSWAWMDSWLRTVGARGASFYVSIHGFSL